MITAGLDRGLPFVDVCLADGTLERFYLVGEPKDGAAHTVDCVDQHKQ